MPKLLKTILICLLTACLALGGGIVASGGIYDAYKLAFGEGRWQTKYNSFVDAASSLGSLVANWVGTVDTLTLIQTAPAYSDASTFTLAGNYSALLTPGKRLVADCGADGLLPNTVVSCTYVAPNSTVVVTTANLTANLAAVSYYATRNGLNTYGSGDIVASEFGAPSWANLQSAVALANTSGRRLLLTPGTWPVTDNLTVTAPLHPVPGALLEIATTKTLAINGALGAGLDQIFSCVGTGKVVLAAGAVEQIHPEWWAANATPGTTDMSAAILAAYTAAQDAGRGLVRLLANQYAVADLVLPRNLSLEDILLQGSGQGTRIVPAAGHTAGNPLITLAGTFAAATQRVHLDNFTIYGGAVRTRTKGLLIQPSNAVRVTNISIINCEGTGLWAQRPYDLYVSGVRVYGCGYYDTPVAVEGMTRAASCVVTYTAHGLSGNEHIRFFALTGDWAALNGTSYRVTRINDDSFSIKRDTSGYAAAFVPGVDPGTITRSEPGVKIERDPLTDDSVGKVVPGDWGNQVYWTDNNVEGNYYRALEIIGCAYFNSSGGKLHGVGLGNPDIAHFREMLYVDGSFSSIFRGTIFDLSHAPNAMEIRDSTGEKPGESYTSAVTFLGNSWHNMEKNGGGDDMHVINYDCGDTLSRLVMDDFWFNKSTNHLGTTGRYINITAGSSATNVMIGQGVWAETGVPARRIQDNRTAINRELGGQFMSLQAWQLIVGNNGLYGGSGLTIASGVITITDSFHRIATEGGAASDDLDTINGGRAGTILVLRAQYDTRDVVLKHGTGNIWLNGAADFTLDSDKDVIVLFNDIGTRWVQIGGGDNG